MLDWQDQVQLRRRAFIARSDAQTNGRNWNYISLTWTHHLRNSGETISTNSLSEYQIAIQVDVTDALITSVDTTRGSSNRIWFLLNFFQILNDSVVHRYTD